jgi:hypothetical protein
MKKFFSIESKKYVYPESIYTKLVVSNKTIYQSLLGNVERSIFVSVQRIVKNINLNANEFYFYDKRPKEYIDGFINELKNLYSLILG